jgi:hypothetical protein
VPDVAPVPDVSAGEPAQHADVVLTRPQTYIELAAGERVFAMAGAQARLALVGPAALRVLQVEASHVELELERGLLLGDYDHRQGGKLVIHSPGARTEIVGTLFSVRVLGSQSEVSVVHGKVRVQAGEQQIEVGAGQAWRAGLPAPTRISDSAAAELEQHAKSLRPAKGARGIVVAEPANEASRASRGTPASAPSSSQAELAPTSESKESGEMLYANAERAMRAGDMAHARALLGNLLVDHPQAANRDLAFYDLAMIAFNQGDIAGTRDLLDRLAREPARPSVRELAAYLRCRAVQALALSEAPGCFADFRRRFPNSPHAKGESAQPQRGP